MMSPPTLFLLSPAHCGGRRAALLFRQDASFELAIRLRTGGSAELGEVFSFLSGLYFRGKLSYARAFARTTGDLPGTLVISSGRGLLTPETPVRLGDLVEFSRLPIDPADPRYTEPLLRDLRELADRLPDGTRVVLLGSIATSKYVEILLSVLGPRLCFPEAFVGIGDMSRGAILLRAAEAGAELAYLPAEGALRTRAAVAKGGTS